MEQSIYPRNGSIWMAAQNDRGGGRGAAPMERVNNGFNFCRNPPSGCRDMGVGVYGFGEGADSQQRLLSFHFLEHLEREAKNTRFAWAGGTCPRFAWTGGTFSRVVLYVVSIFGSGGK
jgi:hypothetical protein